MTKDSPSTCTKRDRLFPIDIPYLNATDKPMDDDHVSELHILRAMAKPAYIIACYVTINNSPTSTAYKIPKSSIRGWRDHKIQSRDHSKSDPLDWRFEAQAYCRLHRECNDPIFSSFAISRTATDLAKSRPEYRDEFEEIANQTRKLSQDLLSLCTTTEEVKDLEMG